MKERPILFTPPMVRAILKERKTQTRRVVKITHRTPGLAACLEPPHGLRCRPTVAAELCPYGQPGDRLWVRESFDVPYRQNFPGDRSAAVYRADYLRPTFLDPCVGDDSSRWSPSIHMPRWASRLTLEVTGVRVERLQEISEADAKAEGVAKAELPPDPDAFHPPGTYGYVADSRDDGKSTIYPTAREAYRFLWEKINGPGSWDANPWVWVIEFAKVTEKTPITEKRTTP